MLTPYDAIELQQKLIILYKFILQKKLYDKFYLTDSLAIFKDIESSKQLQNEDLESIDPAVKEILAMENNEEFLEDCLLELEELRPPTIDRDYDININYITNRKSVEFLAKAHGLKDSEDINSLKIQKLIELL
ncbi:MAG: hypothetical protein ACRC1M_01750 [Methanobacteriaceae archaeon]